MRTLSEIHSILSAHKEELRKRYKVKDMGIFGSFVRGEEKEKSDLDILVEFEDVPDLLKFIELERYIEKLLGIKVDLAIRSAVRPELKSRILKDAVEV